MSDHNSQFELLIDWVFGPEGHIDAGTITIINAGQMCLTGARLHVSGMVRLTQSTPLEGAVLVEHLSNYAVLELSNITSTDNGERCVIRLGEPDYPMRHYTEGIVRAYLETSDGQLTDIVALHTTAQQHGESKTPKKMSEEPVGDAHKDQTPLWAIVPRPNHIALSDDTVCVTGLNIGTSHSVAQGAVAQFECLVNTLFSDTSWMDSNSGKASSVTLQLNDSLKTEQYHLSFKRNRVDLQAATETGFLYGLITLGQMLKSSYDGSCSQLPKTGELDDYPAFEFRGCHLDVARQFYSVRSIEQFLCVLAWNKLNRFHWHLSDDEAWRIDVAAYPQLCRVGAWRGHQQAIPPVLGSGAEVNGGFYSQLEVRGIVELAQRLGIVVIPELDMPGHCFAAIQSIPSLSDPDEHPDAYRSLQGFPNNCLNPALPETYRFIEQLLDELVPLFPGPYWHVGADEVPDTAWQSSPAVMHKPLSQDRSAAGLQAYFLQKLQAMLRQRGKITAAWQEGAKAGGISCNDAYLVAWLDPLIAKELANDGYKVVVSAGQAYYLDMAMDDSWSEPGLAWAGSVSLEQSYEFDPTDGWPNELREQCLGVQACIWSEQMRSTELFNYLVFPRLSALAETAWTRKENKHWDQFKMACQHMPVLYQS